MQHMELGKFLRSRREAVSPADVGLPVTPRRRTPGLRRAELATLAGISVDYLVRLEQGRDRNPSGQVLSALADALHLSEDDLGHLRSLAAFNASSDLCPTSVSAAQDVRPQVRLLLDRLEPSPAFVMNRLTDVLAWTTTYERIVRPLGLLDVERPNHVRYTFTDDRAHDAYPDWEQVADEQVGNLMATGHPGDDEGRALVADLRAASPEFDARWSDQPVVRKRTGTKRVRHPEVGVLTVSFETLQLADGDDQRLVVYLPADEATTVSFDMLAGLQPGNLRAVGE